MYTVEKDVKIEKTFLGIKKKEFVIQLKLIEEKKVIDLVDCRFNQAESRIKHFIEKLLLISETTSWEKLVGKKIRIRCFDNGIVVAVGHKEKNIWLDFSEFFSGQ
jgi:hypothetical protein